MQPMRKIKELTAPPVEPLVLADVKTHLRISNALDDTWLTAAIVAARRAAEDYTGLAIITRSFLQTMDVASEMAGQWWSGVREAPITVLSTRSIELLRPPLVSVTSVKTYDDADNATTVASSTYFVDNAAQYQRANIVLRRGQVWPVVMRVTNGMEVEYLAGFGVTAATVPEDILLALKMIVAYLYGNRGDCSCDAAGAMSAIQSSGAAFLLDTHRILDPV